MSPSAAGPAGTHDAPRAWTCPLCGDRVTQDQTACGGCPVRPIGHDCAVLCCPRCGYQFIERSGWLEALGRWWRGKGSS